METKPIEEIPATGAGAPGNGSAGAALPGIMGLAALPPETPLDRADLARMLGKCETSIMRAVKRGELPRPVRLMGRPTWTARAILNHLTARLDAAAREREKLAAKVHALRP